MFNELNEREQKILTALAENGSVSVTALAKTLSVSEVTIRSELTTLEEKGWLSRTRGGASAAVHRDIMERQKERIAEKTAIARTAAELVQDGDVIMIEAGTTTALIAKFLLGRRDVHVVTNSTLAFTYARLNPALQVTITGGEFRRYTESLVGPIALSAIGKLNVRLAFVGTDGFTLERGITTHLVEGAEIVKAMRDRAATTVLVADSSKWGRAGFASVLPLSKIDVIVTDAALEAAAEAELRKSGIDIRIAK